MLRFFTRTNPQPLFVAATYRGCRRGWQPVGAPRDRQAAERMVALLGRLFPDFIHRSVAL